MPSRGDFDVEWDNDAEHLICDCVFDEKKDSDLDREVGPLVYPPTFYLDRWSTPPQSTCWSTPHSLHPTCYTLSPCSTHSSRRGFLYRLPPLLSLPEAHDPDVRECVLVLR